VDVAAVPSYEAGTAGVPAADFARRVSSPLLSRDDYQRVGGRDMTTDERAEGSRSAALAELVGRLRHRRRSDPAVETPVAEVDQKHKLETVEARVAHLEAELEGLQDALYRHQVLVEQNIGDLRRRTGPEQVARDLSDDARRRGL